MSTALMDLQVLELTELDSRVMLCDEGDIEFCCCCTCCTCTTCCCSEGDCEEIENLS